MVPLLRPLVMLGVLVLTLGSLLPPWEICWHADGSVCVNPEPVPCCDEEQTNPAADPEPCSDCADLATFEALKNDDRPRETSVTASPLFLQPPVLALQAPTGSLSTGRAIREPPRALSTGLLSPPIRC